MNPVAKFHIGQKVNAVSFVDCFGKVQVEREALTVTDINLVAESSIPAYYRVRAEKPGVGVEGAERFFEAAAHFIHSCTIPTCPTCREYYESLEQTRRNRP